MKRKLFAAVMLATGICANAATPYCGGPLAVNTSNEGTPYTYLLGSYLSIWEPTQDGIATGFATRVRRTSGGQLAQTIGGQFNAWSGPGVSAQTWGFASEAVAELGSQSVLVGGEILVANWEPTNYKPKIGLNLVFKNTKYIGEGWSPDRNNDGAVGIWFTSDTNTGFPSAIKFARHSLAPSATQARAAVLDLSEIDTNKIVEIDLILLPGGKAIFWNPVTQSLQVR